MLFNLYADKIMRDAELEYAEEGIRLGGRNLNNLRYADDTTLLASRIEHLKNLIRKVQLASERGGLYLNLKKTKVMSTGNITSFSLDNEEIEVVNSITFLGSLMCFRTCTVNNRSY